VKYLFITVHMETLDRHFRTLAKAAFVRHGFASEQLISQWSVIVGQPFAAFSSPDKIKWPKTATENARKTGGTLVIRAHAGRGLDLHYEAPRIMERVNQFLGYGAITAIKIIQTNEQDAPEKIEPPPMSAAAAQAWDSKIDDITDDGLRAALARLASHAAPNGPKVSVFSTGENRDWPLPPTSVRKSK
jgi:hypothetical protein